MQNNYGGFVRLLMYNHSRNILTKKQELKDIFKMQNQDILSLVEYTKENIRLLGLELLGIEKNNLIDPLKSDKYFLRSKKEIYNYNNKLIIIFVLILLEEGEISHDKLISQYNEINKEYLNILKRDNYIYINKEDNDLVVGLGWKYYVEYGETDILQLLEV
ncbi:segregation and condensation protein B [Vairimorpha necatrix]|uniref:Segregation and condensation protein B n=1 Tax=Vairimorpha necatrix TaxID=6039 RepID=A0AAX4JBX3_9MICR